MKRRIMFTSSGLSRRAILGRTAATGAVLGLTTRLGRPAAQEGTPTSAGTPLTAPELHQRIPAR